MPAHEPRPRTCWNTAEAEVSALGLATAVMDEVMHGWTRMRRCAVADTWRSVRERGRAQAPAMRTRREEERHPRGCFTRQQPLHDGHPHGRARAACRSRGREQRQRERGRRSVQLKLCYSVHTPVSTASLHSLDAALV